MNDELLSQYRDLWTTNLHKYVLIQLDPSRPAGYLLRNLESGGITILEAGAPTLVEIFKRMRAAGVRVVTLDEAWRL